MTLSSAILSLIEEADEAVRIADRKSLSKQIHRAELLLPSVDADERRILEALILHWQAFGFYLTSRFQDALPLFEQARHLYTQLGEPSYQARALKNIGACYQFLGDIKSAMAMMESARSIYHEIGNVNQVGTTMGNIGNLYLLEGDYAAALAAYESSLAIHREMNDHDGIARTTGNIGNLFKETGRYDEALKNYNESLHAYQMLNDPSGIARISGNIGGAHYAIGSFAEALEWYYRALALHEAHGDRQRIARLRSNIAGIYAETKDHEKALELYTQALHVHEEINDKVGIAHITGIIGQEFDELGRTDEAIDHLTRAIEMFRTLGSRRGEAYNVNALIVLLIDRGRFEEANELLKGADALAADLPVIQSDFLVSHARIAMHHGDRTGAIRMCEEALDIARSHHARRSEVTALKTMRDLHRTDGPLSKYIEYDDAYEELAEELSGELQQRRLAVATAERKIFEERRLTDRQRVLLYNALPPSIAERLLNDEEDVADLHDNVTVLFMDIVDFTRFAQQIEPVELVRFLNRIFTACDELCANHGMMKIKTIGDSYMAVAFEGVDRAARVACEMLALTIEWPGARSERVQFRIGLHVGPVVAGVVGSERLQYDVWGDTVNVASRLEGTSLPGHIHVSQDFATGIREQAHGTWHLALRGEIELKGKGTLSTYWLSRV